MENGNMSEIVFAVGVLFGMVAAIIFSTVLLAEGVDDCTQASSYHLCVVGVDWARAPMSLPLIFRPLEAPSHD